ncbi:MarR family winged helix-turn-helix transcriptional regulator [Pseudoprimorskyibacter insulae]|uniref:HTH marR-type domain-containing protein n=1 Tax=Pseudoprimorskyibacter insulae TaxID=1695997 RepID=A0A2R8AW17_9RHOB|nr:MarR family transcriptional regulator [Pseudoprimorskyibacter insulae]SPF80225.1 hypothetical protein PRI8871_02031 [Pseudoprimorskyibacter insulae]
MNAVTPTPTEDDIVIGELSGSLGFLLRMAQLQVFEGFYRELAKYELKPGEFSVMWVISRNLGIRQGALARKLRIKPAHMTKLIQRMEASGYVERIIPEDDRRSVILGLTETGYQFVNTRKAEFFSYYLQENAMLPEEDMATLIGLLQKLSGFKDET